MNENLLLVVVGLASFWFGVNLLLRSWRKLVFLNQLKYDLDNGLISPEEAKQLLNNWKP